MGEGMCIELDSVIGLIAAVAVMGMGVVMVASAWLEDLANRVRRLEEACGLGKIGGAPGLEEQAEAAHE